MNKRVYVVPPESARNQARAADPNTSAWVSANAGSGKTHVLAQRVMRLLLGGTDPAKILCLTYTRAAAANMSNRVFASLANWTMLDDEALRHEIEALEGRKPGGSRLRAARRLFAQALETPGGLKIQTIHAFCEALLHQFPLEANIAAHFELLDREMEAALFATARREMLTGAVSGNPALAEAFAAVLERAGEAGLSTLLAEIVARRDGLRRFIGEMAGDASPYSSLFEEFGFAPGDTAASVAADVWPLASFPPAYFQTFRAAALASGGRIVTDRMLPDLEQAFAEPDPVNRLRLLSAGFLKSDGQAYSSAFTKALLARLPGLDERYAAAASAVTAASDRLALFRMLQGTRAALTIADWLIARYEQLKTGRGFLDFNDLVMRAASLLQRQDAGAWVHYKLDQGIDHILLDEAQDTSPDQWNVVTGLTGDFFTGAGARESLARTVFAVGDEKQSIYSFQGAVPESFYQVGRSFSQKVKAAAAGFETIRLTLSFRSTNDVLYAVDRVFAQESARRGLTVDESPISHEAIRFDAPGCVELWPSLGPEAFPEPEDWRQTVDHAKAPAVRLADTVARTIRRWIDSGERIDGQGRPIRAGDVMVLVRKRDSFVHALSRRLKELEIPVAGADRLLLATHIAVRDLVALGRFLVQPEDDLSLAALLRSPIFGLSEEALFELSAPRRPKQSLIAALRAHAALKAGLASVVESLDRWSTEAAFRPVFEFYSGVLARDGVRRKMVARLGHEAADILDEFLSFCLAEERTGLPGLEALLATLETASPEIKREIDQNRDEVRVMTVHAAKGLEAPIVFLVDGGGASSSDQHLPRLMPFQPTSFDWQGVGYLWRSTAEIANDFSRSVVKRARERADDEYRRLLYVGMTRAEDRLIVCGYHGKRQPGPATWHSIVTNALVGAPETQALAHPVTGGPIHRFCVTKHPPLAGAALPDNAAQIAELPLPPELLRPLAEDEDLLAPLSPSGASVLVESGAPEALPHHSPVLDTREASGAAIRRGVIIHKLLEMLPDMPVDAREPGALRYIARAAPEWDLDLRTETWRQVSAILTDPDFAPLFSPASRAEIAVMGEVAIRGRRRSVAGKIDRIVDTGEAVIILDYKTGRAAPTAIEEVPRAYIVQLALYRALIAPLYPGKPVMAALLFTDAPRLLRVPAAALDGALVGLASA